MQAKQTDRQNWHPSQHRLPWGFSWHVKRLTPHVATTMSMSVARRVQLLSPLARKTLPLLLLATVVLFLLRRMSPIAGEGPLPTASRDGVVLPSLVDGVGRPASFLRDPSWHDTAAAGSRPFDEVLRYTLPARPAAYAVITLVRRTGSNDDGFFCA